MAYKPSDKEIKELMDDIGFFFRKSNWEELEDREKSKLHNHLVSIWYILGDVY